MGRGESNRMRGRLSGTGIEGYWRKRGDIGGERNSGERVVGWE